MADYHVGCGLFGIYAGTVKKNGNEWKDKSEVTDEAIDAVRDYLFHNLKDGEKSNGYEWKLKDGRKVKLVVIVENENEINQDTNKEDE